MSARILVVEDDPDTLEFMALMLRGWGYVCDVAASGAEALAAVTANCPDVIISDLAMPGMGGMDLLKAIRSENVNCRSAFFLLTGHASVSVAVEAIEEGADECLCKPVNPVRLRSLLQQRGFVGDRPAGT